MGRSRSLDLTGITAWDRFASVLTGQVIVGNVVVVTPDESKVW
jgi:hypothetical protein